MNLRKIEIDSSGAAAHEQGVDFAHKVGGGIFAALLHGHHLDKIVVGQTEHQLTIPDGTCGNEPCVIVEPLAADNNDHVAHDILAEILLGAVHRGGVQLIRVVLEFEDHVTAVEFIFQKTPEFGLAVQSNLEIHAVYAVVSRALLDEHEEFVREEVAEGFGA